MFCFIYVNIHIISLIKDNGAKNQSNLEVFYKQTGDISKIPHIWVEALHLYSYDTFSVTLMLHISGFKNFPVTKLKNIINYFEVLLIQKKFRK